MRRGLIAAPPFMPPGGMRFPAPPPMMPPMPVNMPQPPMAPQQQVTGEQQQAPTQQGAPHPGTPPQGFPGVPALQGFQGMAAPQGFQGMAAPQGFQGIPAPQGFPPAMLPPAWSGVSSPGGEQQGGAASQAGQESWPSSAPDPASQFWSQQQALMQQLMAQQAMQQQAALSAFLPSLLSQPQLAAVPQPQAPAAAPMSPAPTPVSAEDQGSVRPVMRTARPGTYTTKGREGGYSTRR